MTLQKDFIKMSKVVVAGKPLVTTTYNLKGDGSLVLHCYEVLKTVMLSIQCIHSLNITAVGQI